MFIFRGILHCSITTKKESEMTVQEITVDVITGKGISVPASQVLRVFRFDENLPTKEQFEDLRDHSDAIPERCQEFRLLFPRAYSKGLSEGQGDKVTDDTIPFLKFEEGSWVEGSLSTGHVWGGHQDDPVTSEYRLAKFTG